MQHNFLKFVTSYCKTLMILFDSFVSYYISNYCDYFSQIQYNLLIIVTLFLVNIISHNCESPNYIFLSSIILSENVI